MFKPSYKIDTCPICGAKLETKEFMGFGLTAGYNSECPNCKKYGDIWSCGIRELQCGDWHSESYMSDYGTLTDEEVEIEKDNLKKLNRLIRKEKFKRLFKK